MQMRSTDRTCSKYYSWGLAASVLLHWKGAQWCIVSLPAGSPTSSMECTVLISPMEPAGRLAHAYEKSSYTKYQWKTCLLCVLCHQIQRPCCAALASYCTRLGLFFKIQSTPFLMVIDICFKRTDFFMSHSYIYIYMRALTQYIYV
jgi:hypothetical protein